MEGGAGGEAGEGSQDQPTDGTTQEHESNGGARAVRVRALQQFIVVERLVVADVGVDEVLQRRAGRGRCRGFLAVPHFVLGEYDSRAGGIVAEHPAVHRPDEDR